MPKQLTQKEGEKKSNCHILTHSYTLFCGDRQLVLFSAIHRGDKRNILVQQKLIIANSLWTSSSVEKTIANFVGNGVFFFQCPLLPQTTEIPKVFQSFFVSKGLKAKQFIAFFIIFQTAMKLY